MDRRLRELLMPVPEGTYLATMDCTGIHLLRLSEGEPSPDALEPASLDNRDHTTA